MADNHPSKPSYPAQQLFNKHAEELLRTFYGLVRVIKIYHKSNQIVVESVKNLIRIMCSLLKEGEDLTIKITNGRFYVQDEKLIYNREKESLFNTILQYFEERNLVGLQFFASITASSHDEILEFC